MKEGRLTHHSPASNHPLTHSNHPAYKNMAHVTPLHLAHLPPHIQIFASLHTSVTNSPEIRSQLFASNHDYDYAFIDATTLISTTHILTAIFRAVNDWMAGRLKTRNVHSEVVFSLGPNNNVSVFRVEAARGNSSTSLRYIEELLNRSRTSKLIPILPHRSQTHYAASAFPTKPPPSSLSK